MQICRLAIRASILAALGVFGLFPVIAQTDAEAAQRLIGVVLGPSPMEENLRTLTDGVGGRVSGSPANRRAVEWAVQSFRQAGVDSVRREQFTMPVSWAEGDTRLEVLEPAHFDLRAVSLGWSPATPSGGLGAPVVDIGNGSEGAFARLASLPRALCCWCIPACSAQRVYRSVQFPSHIKLPVMKPIAR